MTKISCCSDLTLHPDPNAPPVPPRQGRGGWTDSRHLDAAWVSVKLRDVNDNPPQFHRPHAHVTVREDAAPGTLLAALPAHDPDMVSVSVHCSFPPLSPIVSVSLLLSPSPAIHGECISLLFPPSSARYSECVLPWLPPALPISI
ncbi:putative neural-cadherin 2 [Portunus trituberculatus]|uniref:Putative neural-cadherin 2 n=1 Tax=Portunus trituberculatus TaxID=210409 RepID=A0A5B7HH29_PORTR|nr:putative neural-cadherin 2 [Portunus trituberculatus]